MTKIIQISDSRIRKKALAVKKITPEIKKLVSEMKQSTSDKDNALAVAGPQLGINKRLVVIKKYKNKKKKIDIPAMVLINPKIIKKSKQETEAEEGCLSLAKPEIRAQVSRADQVTIKYQDLSGQKQTKQAQGLLARIFQHEIDHLNGKVFTDRANPTTIHQAHDDE